MLESDRGGDLSSDRKTEAIERIRRFEGRFTPLTEDMFQFIGRLCTQTNLSDIIDPGAFRVPLTDTMSVGIRRVTIRKSSVSGVNPGPESKGVTIPVFHFDNKQDGVKFDGENTDGPNSIFKQKKGRLFARLYNGKDNINYSKAVEGLLCEAYMQQYGKQVLPSGLLDIARNSDWFLFKLALKGYVNEWMQEVYRLEREEVIKRFIQAINPIEAVKQQAIIEKRKRRRFWGI